jgi:hypothetical protein
VSSMVVDRVVSSLNAVTVSRRRYELVGPAGTNREAEYVKHQVANLMGGGQTWTYITEWFIPEWEVDVD